MEFRLEFQGIRCFAEKQSAALRPITLLVGENSSGKSTFLALCQIASSIASPSPASRGFPHSVSFNEPPFLLGAYDQIASHTGRRGPASSFWITLRAANADHSGSVHAEFRKENGQPILHLWQFREGNLNLEARADNASAKPAITLHGSEGECGLRKPYEFNVFGLLNTGSTLWSHLFPKLSNADAQRLAKTFQEINSIFAPRPFAFAPVRTGPQRTYRPVHQAPEPEGSHVPMLLARLARTSPARWKTLRKRLGSFGQGSKLFDAIEVIEKGGKETDPFQIGVHVAGTLENLADVDYGVSQVLPILVDTLHNPDTNRTFLWQEYS